MPRLRTLAGMKRKPRIEADPEDIALFHEAIGPVRRIEAPPAPPAAPKPRPKPRQHEADEIEALRESRSEAAVASALAASEDLRYLADGRSPRLLRRLRRGQYAVQDEIDLHHLSGDQAEAVLRQFLGEARAAGHLCLRIVHGKGQHSRDGIPVVRNRVDALLRRRGEVLAFTSAPPAQGGSGALLVLLKPVA